MADRVVKVSLRAEINNYLAGMEQARKKTQETGTEAEKTAAKLQAQKEAFNLIGGTLLAAGTIAAAAVGVAVKKWMDFDEAMSAVAAATHETEANMSRLRDAALDAGARTVFSASEAANAIEELGKAGLTTEEILSGGLNGALDLAAAGGLAVADAAGIAAVAVKTFKLEGKDVGHVADLLAAGAGKAMGDVTDLSAALSQGGQVAAATGLSIEETTGSLAAFASQGLLGSDAGTSFKTMLQSLNPRSAEAAKLMRDLGISAYDANGNFIGMEKYAGRLQKGLSGLSTEQRNAAMSTIFGSDAVRAANVLYSEGEDGIRDWIAAVDDQGYAAETAAKRLDNLKGDWEQFGGAVETASIKAGEVADGPLRFLTQTATDMVQAFADAPEGMQGGVLAIAAAGAAASVAGGLFLVAVPKIVEFRAAIETLGPTAQRTGRILGRALSATAAIGGVTASVFIVNQLAEALSKDLLPSAAEVENAFKASTSALDRFRVASDTRFGDGFTSTDEAIRQLEQLDKALEASAKSSEFLGIQVQGTEGEVLDTLKVMGKQYAQLAQTDLPAAQAGFRDLLKYTDGTAQSQWRLINALGPDYMDALRNQASALGITADKTNLLKLAFGETEPAARDNADALAELEGKAKATEGAVDGLADAIRGFGSANLDTRSAAREFEDALDAVGESLESQKAAWEEANGSLDGFVASLDIGTAEGRENQANLDAISTSTLNLAAATLEQTGSQEQANGVIAAGRERLIEMLAQFGITGDAANAYADELGLIPGNVNTAANFTDDGNAGRYKFLIDSIPSRKDITIHATKTGADIPASDVFYKAFGGVMEFYAGGGIRRPRENHVAQIAPAGAWRVWAEDETGGEAYIPLAPGKRDQSVAVLDDVAGRFGFGLMQLASGAVMPPVYATSYGGWGGGTSGKLPSLDGLSISGTLEIGGDGLARIINGHIGSALAGEEAARSAGFGGL